MHDKSEKVRRVSQLVVLSSLTIVLRVVFGPFPNIKPLTAIFLISSVLFQFAGELDIDDTSDGREWLAFWIWNSCFVASS